MGAAFTHRLFGQLRALRRDGWHVQDLALLANRGSFQGGGLNTHGATSWSSSPS
jgi:hypothetical protein